MNKPITYGLDYESRPQWDIVNPQILGSFYAMINRFAEWKKKKIMGAGEKNAEYFEWNQHLIEIFMKVEAQFGEEKEEEYQKVYVMMKDFIDEKRELSLNEKIFCIHCVTKFLKKMGLTKVEVESARKFSLLGSE